MRGKLMLWPPLKYLQWWTGQTSLDAWVLDIVSLSRAPAVVLAIDDDVEPRRVPSRVGCVVGGRVGAL